MRKTFIIIGVILAIATFITLMIVFTGGNYYARITELDFRAEVIDNVAGDNGKVLITETITYDVRARSRHEDDRFWEFWRDLPEETVDGVKITYDVKSVARIMPDGQRIPFGKASRAYWYDEDYVSTASGLGPNHWFHDRRIEEQCVLFYVDGIYREKVTFEVVYEMFNASLRYRDCSELTLVLYEDKSAKYLESVTAQIVFPNGKMPAEGNYEVHTYGTIKEEFNSIVNKSVNDVTGDTIFSFELEKEHLKFKPYNSHIEFILVAFGDDKHIFTEHASRNTYYNQDVLTQTRKEHADYLKLPAKYKTAKIILVIAFSGTVALIMLGIYWIKSIVWKKLRLSKTKYTHLKYCRDVPGALDPTFAGALVFCKHKTSDKVEGAFSAALIGLISKKYIALDKFSEQNPVTPENTRVTVLPEPADAVTMRRARLNASETLVYDLFVRHVGNTPASLQVFQQRVGADYDNTHTFELNMKELVKTIGMTEGYFQSAEYKKYKGAALGWSIGLAIAGAVAAIPNTFIWLTRLDLAFGAFFILAAGLMCASILSWMVFSKLILLTQLGEDEYTRWRALYMFMKKRSQVRTETIDEGNLDNYLIYATAFGISDKVLKALYVRFPQLYESQTSLYGHPYIRTRCFTSYGRSFRTTTRRASFTSRMNSGGSYGRGGRGGGGGG